MLRLFDYPQWCASPDTAAQRLPVTVPAAVIIVLATHGEWMDRETLGALLWPELQPVEARHHLRVSLHRARAMLGGWGQAEQMQAETHRVRLQLPSDVQHLRDALAQPGPGAASSLATLQPTHWLGGWRLPRYTAVERWLDTQAQRLQREWRQALSVADASAPSSTPLTTSTLQAPPGRASEHQQLLHNTAPAVLMLGEPGMGKSTLLRAAFPGVPCLQGHEGLHVMPYRPLADALRQHLGALTRALRDPTSALRPYRLDLARLLPELAPDEPLPALDALTAKARLAEALARAFEALTPLLCVDDLQWCDPATLDWLVLLAHRGHLRWRAAARQHELRPETQATLDALQASGRLQPLQLLPLSREQLGAVCRQTGPSTLAPSTLDALHAASGGNPFWLAELLAADVNDTAAPEHWPERVSALLQRRLHSLPALALEALHAAAVFVHPVPASALHRVCLPNAADDEAATGWPAALASTVLAGLLQQHGGLYSCRHDLIRHAVLQLDAEPATAGRPAQRHRAAALWLGGQDNADALAVAAHWRAADEPQTALAWLHRGATQLKARGNFEQARALWREVAESSLDAAQSLRARLELAACDLLEDLPRGLASLHTVQHQLAAVADAEQQREIEGRVLSALVDNRVFAGDIAQAARHAQRLRELLPLLQTETRIEALEVLIELAMREPDIDAAWACLAQVRQLAPQRPQLLSFEGQIHWFSGHVRAARDALARMLERYPEHCQGITIENDLAVMQHALGELAEAEALARRSLHSWQGVAHTETLSLLVLGSVLTSAGRHDEAAQALARALVLAQEQSSPRFVAEARVRQARLWLQTGELAQARAALAEAATFLHTSPEPLRVSQYLLTAVLVALAVAAAVDPQWLPRLRTLAQRSGHPLVHARLAWAEAELALAAGSAAAALSHARAMVAVAETAGLAELQAEGHRLCRRLG
jgi:tetratricopeptide (TPR) repeat protein